MRALVFLFLLLPVLPVYSLDLAAYLHQDHDKLYFGLGGGSHRGLNPVYRDRFPKNHNYHFILQAGIGDYPIVWDIRYIVLKDEGFSETYISGAGAELTEYQVLSGGRIYLFWAHKILRQYVLMAVLASQETLVSSGPEPFRSGDIRMGIAAGLGFDLRFNSYSFIDLNLIYRHVRSDIFGYKEVVAAELIFNIGK